MAAEVFNIRPEDGWVAVTDAAVSFIKIRTNVAGHGFLVTSGADVPDADADGYRVVCGEEFYIDVPVADNFYVKTVESSPAGQRISVFTVPGA